MALTSNLSRYRPVRRIASGGMATITLAEDTVLGRPVALKRLIGAVSSEGITRLRREALVGASVSHPNLVSIYDVIAEDDGAVIVMEYVDGRTLKEAVAQEGRLAAPEAIRILHGVASALDAIHARGIVHRDVKPPNILLGRGGEVKLADLGIAAAPDLTSITTEGSVLGSLSYMAPEQLEAAPASPAMDIYALSTVAFEALSGRRARLEDNAVALAHAIATQPPPDLRKAWPGASVQAADLLSRGMARDPADRPASAGALVGALDTALLGDFEGRGTATAETRPIAAAAPTAPTRAIGAPALLSADPLPGSSRRRTGWMAPLVLGLVALAVLAVVLSSQGTPHRNVSARSAHTHRAITRATHTTPTNTSPAASPVQVHGQGRGQTHGKGRGKGNGQGNDNGDGGDPAGNQTPVGAVESFYELAAAHRFGPSWALADANFRRQLGGYDSFVAGQEGDRRIIFRSARVVSQTAGASAVAIRTTSIRSDGTQHCGGTVELVPGGGGWLLNRIDINC